MKRKTDHIQHDNYKEHLNWFNTSVKPNITTSYVKKFQPIPVQTNTNNNNNTSNVDQLDPEFFFDNFDDDTTKSSTTNNHKRKRSEEYEAIDLTNSQPTSKRHDLRQSPLISPNIDLTGEDNDEYDDIDDNLLCNILSAENNIVPEQEEDLEDFTFLNENDIANLDNMTSKKPQDLESKLAALKEKQTDFSNRIVEALSSGASPEEIQQFMDQRTQVLNEIKKLEEESAPDRSVPEADHDDFLFADDDIMMEDTLLPETSVNNNATAEYVVLDDDEEEDNLGPIEVSPFFEHPNQSVSMTTPPPAPPPPIVADSSQPSYPWSRDVRKALTQNFKLSEFRPNQLEAINTTLKGEDVFVLMPTGGGKSLCYQLPAIIQRFNRQGVTFVVSPLLSLMQDQVEQLLKKGIASGMLNSVVPAAQKHWVFNDLKSSTPTLQILYVTPELLSLSSQLRDMLKDLYERDKLARFVIDEAHCVSQWGHDFRPEYKQLGVLKDLFPRVPIMALTATANEAVQKDVLFNLKISSCKVLKQSFNRNNLRYEVVKKNSKTVIQDMKQFIAQHRDQSGIIYCCTKKDCESVAESLGKVGISIKHYHAALSTAKRSEVQREWQTGQIQVIAATIAFGMGIDKPDVRFVIHYSVPSSVEGYYQETGRAGRDGKPSVCRLYFSYMDTRTHNYLIDQGEGSYQQKQRQRDNLNTMMRFCDNHTDCRRKVILSYFGESFSPTQCMRMCDNCIQNQHGQSVVRDMSKDACTLIKLIKAISPDHITIAQLIDIYRGSKAKRILERGHDRLEGWGNGRDKQRTEVDRILRAMINEDAIRETAECNAKGFPITYLILSTRVDDVLGGKTKILMTYSKNRTAAAPRIDSATAFSSRANRAAVSTPSATMTGFAPAGSLASTSQAPPSKPRSRRVLPNAGETHAIEERRVLQCFQEMQRTRQTLMAKFNVRSPGLILTDNLLKQIAKKLPVTERELLLATNMKPETFQRYGQHFLNILIKYDKLKNKTLS